MTKGEDFTKRGKCKKNHCSIMSSSAWSDLIKDCKFLKLHDKCPNPKCGCQKIITFTPHQYMLEGYRLKLSFKKFQEPLETAKHKPLGINF